MITALLYIYAGVAVVLALLVAADQLYRARPLPRVQQRQLPPLPGAYAEDVRIRIPSSRSRRAQAELYEDLQARSLACQGQCLGSRRTLHEDHGDGTATCTRCGTPRHTTTDGA